jgi:hypothetical protein
MEVGTEILNIILDELRVSNQLNALEISWTALVFCKKNICLIPPPPIFFMNKAEDSLCVRVT